MQHARLECSASPPFGELLTAPSFPHQDLTQLSFMNKELEKLPSMRVYNPLTGEVHSTEKS